MTPEAYLKLLEQDQIFYEERVGAWNALSETDRYRTRRLQIECYFQPQYLTNDLPEVINSPSGRYSLTLTYYLPGPKRWKYSCGVVSDLDTRQNIAEIHRNFRHFPYYWVEKASKEYLICGEDYQGYGIIDLETAETRHYFPPIGFAGGGFCWAEVRPSVDGRMLAVKGCVWGAPYEVAFFDFDHPLSVPYPLLGRVEDVTENLGWQSDGSYLVAHEYRVRASDGVRYEELSEEEQERLDEEDNLTEYRTEQIRWMPRKNIFEYFRS